MNCLRLERRVDQPVRALFLVLKPVSSRNSATSASLAALAIPGIAELFRPVALFPPNARVISEILFLLEGFMEARLLAEKLALVVAAAAEQLSCGNCDVDPLWSLSSVKLVISIAGNILRSQSGASQENTLITASSELGKMHVHEEADDEDDEDKANKIRLEASVSVSQTYLRADTESSASTELAMLKRAISLVYFSKISNEVDRSSFHVIVEGALDPSKVGHFFQPSHHPSRSLSLSVHRNAALAHREPNTMAGSAANIADSSSMFELSQKPVPLSRAPSEITTAIIEDACKKMRLQACPMLIRRILSLEEILRVQQLVFITGTAGSGKTTAWRILSLCHQQKGLLNTPDVICAGAMGLDELYETQEADGRWRDGVLTKHFRNIFARNANSFGPEPGMQASPLDLAQPAAGMLSRKLSNTFFGMLPSRKKGNDQRDGGQLQASATWRSRLESIVPMVARNLPKLTPRSAAAPSNSKDPKDRMSWLVLDGIPNDACVAPFLFASERNFDFHVEAIGRFHLNPLIRIVMETESLAHASPALVAASMVLHMHPDDIPWEAILLTWVKKITLEYNRRMFSRFIDQFLPHVLEYVRHAVVLAVPRSNQDLARSVCALLDALTHEASLSQDIVSEEEAQSVVAFAVIWGCCGALYSTSGKKGGPSVLEARAEFSTWWTEKFADKFDKFSAKGTVFDYCVDTTKFRTVSWDEQMSKQQEPVFDYDKLPSEVYVPTARAAAVHYALGLLISSDHGGLVLGGAGTGKSCVVNSRLAQAR